MLRLPSGGPGQSAGVQILWRPLFSTRARGRPAALPGLWVYLVEPRHAALSGVRDQGQCQLADASVSGLEDFLYRQIEAAGLPVPEREYRFCSRGFRLDFCWPAARLAVEVEGGVWTGGRHVRPVGFLRDIEKYNLATMYGYRVYRVTGEMIEDGSALDLVMVVLGEEVTG